MKRLFVAALIGVFGGADAFAQERAPDRPPEISELFWLERPSATDISVAFAAVEEGPLVSRARVVLDCVVLADAD